MLWICRRNALLYLGALGVCASLVSACTVVRLDQLVPSTAIDIVSSDGNLLEYVPNPCPQRHVAEIFRSHAIVASNVSKLRVALPGELAQSQVINKLIYQSHYVSARAVQTASLVLTNPTDPPAADKPPSDIALGEVFEFGRLILEHVMRHTPSASANLDPLTDQFWNKLKAYYAFYFQGQFNSYLGNHCKRLRHHARSPMSKSFRQHRCLSNSYLMKFFKAQYGRRMISQAKSLRTTPVRQQKSRLI